MKKHMAAALGVVLLAMFGWLVWERLTEAAPQADRNREPRALAVALAPTQVMTLSRTAEFSGALEARERFVAAPKVAGRLEALHVDIGDVVTDGQVIAELDSREYAQDVLEAEAAVEVAHALVVEAESSLDVAERELERSRRLRQRNAVSESELDQALADFETAAARLQVALAQVRQREAALEAARTRLGYTRIRVDWADQDPAAEPKRNNAAGLRVVGERFVAQGDMVDANDPIIAVAAVDELLAVIHVIERDFPFVKPGQPATIRTDAYPGRVFPGAVARVAPVLQAASRQARVEILVPNPERLLAPGMFARVQLTFETRENVLAAPEAALARRDNVEGVFLAVENATAARFTPVTPGVREDGWVEVTGEAAALLAEGRVVTLGKHLLEDGGAITAPETQDARRDD